MPQSNCRRRGMSSRHSPPPGRYLVFNRFMTLVMSDCFSVLFRITVIVFVISCLSCFADNVCLFKGGNVTSAGWQVTLCDPMWHVSSRSGVATLRTAIHLLLTYLLTYSVMLEGVTLAPAEEYAERSSFSDCRSRWIATPR